MKRLFCGGSEADAEVLAAALTNYGHFTSMQVRAGAVQGLDLHMQRLQQGTRELFSTALDEGQLREWMRSALGACGVADASVRVTVFSRRFDFRRPLQPVDVDVLVEVSAPVSAPEEPRSLRPVAYQREMPHLKHVGTFALFQHRRLALQAGFDDAVFVSASGEISEGTTWNIAFWDGRRVSWPQAPALRGTTEQLLAEGLAEEGLAQGRRVVGLGDLDGFSGAIGCNTAGIWPVSRIGEHEFDQSPQLLALMRSALRGRAWLPI